MGGFDALCERIDEALLEQGKLNGDLKALVVGKEVGDDLPCEGSSLGDDLNDRGEVFVVNDACLYGLLDQERGVLASVVRSK
jgi:hypothetical protein